MSGVKKPMGFHRNTEVEADMRNIYKCGGMMYVWWHVYMWWHDPEAT